MAEHKPLGSRFTLKDGQLFISGGKATPDTYLEWAKRMDVAIANNKKQAIGMPKFFADSVKEVNAGLIKDRQQIFKLLKQQQAGK